MGCCSSKKDNKETPELKTDLKSNLLRARTDVKFADVYSIDEVIGEGSIGSISLVTKKDSQEHFAMKTISLTRVTQGARDELRNEIEILRRLDHPNIVRPLEVFEEKQRLYLVMELCTGGDLYEFNARTDGKEADAAAVIATLVSAISYAHANRIIHRDLKFENVLFHDNSRGSEVKLIDFGLSQKFAKGERLNRVVGTIYSMAPEVLRGNYTEAADVWSVGVLAYMLLSGTMPFGDGSEDDQQMAASIINAKFDFNAPAFENVSEDAKLFVQRCLVKDASKRWKADECLKSKWLTKSRVQTRPSMARMKVDRRLSTKRLLKSIDRFGGYCRLRKAAMMMIVHSAAATDELQDLRAAFQAIDVSNEGVITMAEFRECVARIVSLSSPRSMTPTSPSKFLSSSDSGVERKDGGGEGAGGGGGEKLSVGVTPGTAAKSGLMRGSLLNSRVDSTNSSRVDSNSAKTDFNLSASHLSFLSFR
jgi:calcium-dependent protein kinase